MTTLPSGFILNERQQQSASSSITSTHQQEQHVGQLTVQTADRWRASEVTPLWGLSNRAQETASGKNTEESVERFCCRVGHLCFSSMVTGLGLPGLYPTCHLTSSLAAVPITPTLQDQEGVLA